MCLGADGPSVTMRTRVVLNTANPVVLVFVCCGKQNPRLQGQCQKHSGNLMMECEVFSQQSPETTRLSLYLSSEFHLEEKVYLKKEINLLY